jgi:polysaccharide transporter, PST family
MHTPDPPLADSEASSPRTSGRLRADTLAASVVILLLVTLIQRSVGFGRGILFCRLLSPETLGEWEMALSFLLLAAPLVVLGVPGSFGRYAEYYRQRGHLRTFLGRAAGWTLCTSGTALALVIWQAPRCAEFVFGSVESAPMMRAVAASLAAVIFHHTMTSLLTSLRLYRIVSAMNFAQSLLFAAIALGLLYRSPTALSIVIGYGASSLIAALGALLWTAPDLWRLEPSPEALKHVSFWPKLLRFAFFVWLSNLLGQLFAIADRYMIMHYSGMDAAEALKQVGIYHSSRVIPVMLISFADLLGGLVMPHLSHDWECGRREEVSTRLNLSIKLTCFGMLAFATLVLVGSPFLFEVVLQGRYNEGILVLPWTLAACVWYGIYSVAQNYLWCAERNRLAAVPLLIGLLANIAFNLLLLPLWGLYGAVLATAASTCLCLLVLLLLNRLNGQQLDAGCWIAAAVPASLGAGYWAAGAVATALLAVSFTTNWVLSPRERQQLQAMYEGAVAKLMPRIRLRRRASASV